MKRMLNRLLLVLIVGCAASASLQAQVTTWLTQGTSTGYDQVYDITVDDWGNTYMYGQAEGNGNTITFGSFSQTINTSVAAFIVKVDPAGVVKWMKIMETNWIWPWDIAYGGGAIWFTGQYVTNLNLGQFSLPATGSSGFLARIDTSGTTTNGINLSFANQLKGLAVDALGNPTFVGEHVNSGFAGPGCAQIVGNGTFQNYSSFVGKYDMSNANFFCDWTDYVPSMPLTSGTTQYFNRPMDVATDAAGNTYVVGEFVGGLHWAGAVVMNPHDSSDTYVAKFSPTGAYEWITVSSGTGHTICETIEVSPNGDVTIGGYSSSGTNFGTLQIPNTGSQQSFLVQLDGATGTAVSSRFLGTGRNQIYDIDSDSQSGLYVIGSFGNGTIDLGNGVIGTLSNNTQGGYVTHLDAAMTAQWVKVWGDNCCAAAGWGLELDPTESNLSFGGFYFGNMDIDGITLASTGQNEAFVGSISLVQPSDSIWPGDANDDLIANNLDLLQVGLAFGSSGPARPGATTNWTAQFADLWGSSSNGIDNVHADTDGNGLVDANDTLAINLNYGLMHNKGTRIDATGPLLAARFLGDSLLAGDTATIVIELGTSMDLANGVYGLAFSLQFDTSLVDASSAMTTYGQSWLGSLGANMIKLDKVFESDGQIDFALARTNQQATSGYGEICRMTIIMVDDLTAKDIIVEPFTVELTDVTVIDELGGELGATTASDTVIVYQDGTNAIDPGLASMLTLFPIPADDRLSVRLEGARARSWQLMDLHGALIRENRETRSDFEINTSSLAAGTYFFLMNTDRGIAAKKILIK